MSRAPSQEEREGALRTGGVTGTEKRQIWIISGPLSMKVLVFWGVVIFAAGFFHGRQMRDLSVGDTSPTNVQPAAETAASTSTATSASTVTVSPSPSANMATAPAKVTIRLLKFAPEKIEVKSGETVEWANADLTPHTATSQGGQEINSGAINAGASWRHTFPNSGTFPYFCTFHPEMKGIVVVH
jgi:plastocyanin